MSCISFCFKDRKSKGFCSVLQVHICVCVCVCIPYIVLFCALHDLFERNERVIASDGILLQVTQVDISGDEDLKRVLIISKRHIERNKQDQRHGYDYRSERGCCFSVYI